MGCCPYNIRSSYPLPLLFVSGMTQHRHHLYVLLLCYEHVYEYYPGVQRQHEYILVRVYSGVYGTAAQQYGNRVLLLLYRSPKYSYLKENTE